MSIYGSGIIPLFRKVIVSSSRCSDSLFCGVGFTIQCSVYPMFRRSRYDVIVEGLRTGYNRINNRTKYSIFVLLQMSIEIVV